MILLLPPPLQPPSSDDEVMDSISRMSGSSSLLPLAAMEAEEGKLSNDMESVRSLKSTRNSVGRSADMAANMSG